MSDLKERYVYAVVKGLPRAVRADIERELDTLIEDMLEARCGGEEPTEKDLRVVLTELGTPAELFRKYSPDAGKALIGEGYYPQYKGFLKLLLPMIAGAMLIAHIVLLLIGEMGWGEALLNFFGTTLSALLAAFAGITIAFAVMERRGVRVGMASDTIENLPPVPRHSEVIPRWESAIGLALCAFFGLMLLFFPSLMGVTIEANGRMQRFCIFLPEALRAGWVWITVLTVLGLVRTGYRLLEGRRSLRVLAVSLVCDALSFPAACLIFCRDGLLNPAFRQAVGNLLVGVPDFVFLMFDHFNLFFLGVILFALALDMIDDTVRTLRARA